MSSSFAGIELGKRSLMAHATQINTAGHNISNADTQGYSRQRVNVRAFDPLYRPDLERAETPGQIGQGTAIDSVERLRDELLDSRIVSQDSQETYWETRDKYYVMLEQIHNEPQEISVRTNMDKFWDAWQELSLYPELTEARQAVVVRGQSLVNSIRQQNTALQGISTLLNGDIEATVEQVNTLSKQIADTNKEIERSKAMGDNPNDLLDRRDLMVEKLSKLVNVTTDQRDSDEYMVHVDGKILVQGGVYREFNVQTLTDGTGYSKVVWKDTGDNAVFTSGTLGALVELRDSDVRSEMQSLNTMTMNFTDLVNDVHKDAVGANNVGGLDFFTQEPFVANVKGNFDRNGDGTEDSSYIFRVNGANSLKPTEQIGIQGMLTLSGHTQLVEVPYYPTDRVEDVVSRINDSDTEVKAYLDRNKHLVLKATTSEDATQPDFVIRHIEDSGRFLVGYAGILKASGTDGAYDFAQADSVDLLQSTFAVSPIMNVAGYVAVNERIIADIQCVAASFPNTQGYAEAGDGNAAIEIAAIRNTKVMIGSNETLDDYFANAVTRVGLKGEQAQINLMSQQSIMQDLRNLRDSISGVNVDEELADIIKFQHGYNAAAKFVTVQDEMLDTIINRLGV